MSRSISSPFSPVTGKFFKRPIVFSWSTVKYSSLNVAVMPPVVAGLVAVGSPAVAALAASGAMSVCVPTLLVVVLSATEKSINKHLHSGCDSVRAPTNTSINVVATVAAKR